MDTTSTTTMATYNAAASSAVAAANNWATVERELPSLTGPSASQPYQVAVARGRKPNTANTSTCPQLPAAAY